MHVQVKQPSLVIFTFKDLNYANISPWRGCVNMPDRPFLNRVSLRSDKNDNKNLLRALIWCHYFILIISALIWRQKYQQQLFFNITAKYEVIWPITFPARSNWARFTYLSSAVFKPYWCYRYLLWKVTRFPGAIKTNLYYCF